jgi:hypothetical protein
MNYMLPFRAFSSPDGAQLTPEEAEAAAMQMEFREQRLRDRARRDLRQKKFSKQNRGSCSC